MIINTKKIKEIKTWNEKRIVTLIDNKTFVIELKKDFLEISSNDLNIIFNCNEKSINITANDNFSILKENCSAIIVSFDFIKIRIYIQKILIKITLYDPSFNILFEDVFYLKNR